MIEVRSIDEYRKYRVTLPCACDSELCEEWAAIPNDPISIEDHLKFHTPKKDDS